MVDTFDHEERKRKKWVDGQEIENNSDKLFIQYDVGSIFARGKMSKGFGSLIGGIATVGQGLVDVTTNVLTFGHGTNMLGSGSIQNFQADIGSIKGRHPSVSGVYYSEFATEDHRGGGPFGNQAGSYILPYFYGYSKDDKDDAGNKLRFNQSKKKFEVDTHNLPAHYLYTHCYYNFRVYGEDFAKMYGVEKMSGSNIYGFEWGASFTNNVSWHMTAWVFYGQYLEYLDYDCMLKEDLNTNDGGLAKWAAMAIGTLALNAGGAAISGLANCATVSEEGAMNTARAKSINRAADTLTFRDWTGNSKDRAVPMNSSAAVKAANDMREELATLAERDNNAEAWGAMKKQVGGAVSKSVGHAFSTLPKTFFGGRGHYSGSIDEFLENKAHWPLLYVEARTSYRYQNLWLAEMNRRLIQWDFWFGNDPEIALKKDFGMCVGKGYDEYSKEGVLKDLHGWIQLGENTIFYGKKNPFIEEWIEEDKFVYQLRRSHKVYHRTVKDFFEGFKGELTFGFQRAGSHTDFDITRKEEVITTDRIHSSNTYAFAGFWCESGTIPVGREGGYTIGEPASSFSRYGGGYTGGGSGYLCQYREGTSKRINLNWSDYQAYKNKSYQKITFGQPDEELRFGTGSGTIVCRYMKGDSDEEEIYQTDDPEHTTWVLKKDTDRYKDGICLFKEVKGIKILTQKVEVDFNSLNLQFTVNIQGFSGIEGWGNNPPDSFGGSSGGGGLPITNPAWVQVLSSGGMMLPDTNTLNTNQLQMPAQIQSMVNTEQVFTPLEMPQLSPLQNLMNMNQEYFQNTIGQQENIHQGLHDKVQQKQKDKDKETIKE